MLVYYIYNAFPPFLAAWQRTRNWRRMTSFVSLLPRKRSSVPVRFHRLNCSSVVAIVAEIVETTIFLLAREVENKIYKGGIVWISECYLSKMSSHVILSYPPPPPGFARSAVWRRRGGIIKTTELGVWQNGARCYAIDVVGMDRREPLEKTKCDNTYDRESQLTGRRSTGTRRCRTAARAEHCSMIPKDRRACPKMTATRARRSTLLARTVMVLLRYARGSIEVR